MTVCNDCNIAYIFKDYKECPLCKAKKEIEYLKKRIEDLRDES